jgi:hypothetical protein
MLMRRMFKGKSSAHTLMFDEIALMSKGEF